MIGRSGLLKTRRPPARWLVGLILLGLVAPAETALAQSEGEAAQPAYLADRGPGLPTSLFGTYIQKGEWLIYPFFEYTRTSQFEYHPSELGFVGDTDYFGKLTENEYLLFISYGFTDGFSFELEGALHTSATLDKAPEDTSAMPDPLEESGVGDIQAELRWRWSAEGEKRPEMFSWFEVVFPNQNDNVLIGTQDWEYSLGFGVVKGHHWGTLTGRVALAYEVDEGQGKFEFGEYAIEYLKKLSPTWRIVAALEGESDELSAIFEGQATLGKHFVLKLNSGFGLTTQAPEFAPEIGLLISF